MLASDAITGATRHHLRKYGPRIPAILESGAEVISATGAVRGEITQAVRNEAATTLSDILLRRTGIAWGPGRGLDCHRLVAEIAGDLLGWDMPERAAQVAAFEADVAKHLPAPDELAARA